MALKAIIFATSMALVAGCASSRIPGGTAALDESSPVQGRDLGRGGATSGGNSSLDPSGNAADWSVYEAREEDADR